MRAAQVAAGDASGGGADGAYLAARRAVSIEPNLASTHRALAEIALTLGDAELALTESIAAMRLAPADASADGTAAAAALRHPDQRTRSRAAAGGDQRSGELRAGGGARVAPDVSALALRAR